MPMKQIVMTVEHETEVLVSFKDYKHFAWKNFKTCVKFYTIQQTAAQ